MQLSLTKSQAILIKNVLRAYNTELLTSSDDFRDYDNIFEQIADLSDTSRATIFDNDPMNHLHLSINNQHLIVMVKT